MFDAFKPTKDKADKLFKQAMQTGNLEPAIVYYRKYLEKNPRDFEAQNDLGWMLLEAEQPEEARACFEAANEVEESAVHYNNLGRALIDLELFDEADEAFEQALELEPDNPEPRYNRAVALREQGDMDGFEEALEALLDEHPDYPPALNDYAVCLQEDERLEDSIEYLERAVDERPMWGPARLNLIATLCDLGRYPEATEHLEALSEMGVDVLVDVGDEDVIIELNGQPWYEGELVEGVPGFGE